MRRKFRCDSNCWNIMKCRRTNCKTGMDYPHNSIINHKFWLCADQLIIICNFTHFTLYAVYSGPKTSILLWFTRILFTRGEKTSFIILLTRILHTRKKKSSFVTSLITRILHTRNIQQSHIFWSTRILPTRSVGENSPIWKMMSVLAYFLLQV